MTTRRVGNASDALCRARVGRGRAEFPCADGKDPASVAAHVPPDAAAVAFCRAREELRVAEKATRDERAEQADAQRVLSGLLCESMQRHGVACVGCGRRRRDALRAALGGARPRVLHDEDAVLALVRDATAAIAACPRGGRVAAVVRLARDRLLAQALPPGRPRHGGDHAASRDGGGRAAPAAAAPAAAAAGPLARAPAETQRLLAQLWPIATSSGRRARACSPCARSGGGPSASCAPRWDADGAADGARRGEAGRSA